MKNTDHFTVILPYRLKTVIFYTQLTDAGGDVSGLSSTNKSINVFISRNSTGSVGILFARMSNRTSRKYVTSTGKLNSRLLRNNRLFRCARSLMCGGKCVSWLHDASSSVRHGIRPSSSGNSRSRLLETTRTCSGSWHISRGSLDN